MYVIFIHSIPLQMLLDITKLNFGKSVRTNKQKFKTILHCSPSQSDIENIPINN